MDFNSAQVQDFIKNSLAEDLGNGDHSSLASIPKGSIGQAHILFKEEGIVAGLQLAVQILTHLDPRIEIDLLKQDGDHVCYGEKGMVAKGNVHALLAGERLLLNCMQRLSGIATITKLISDKISHTQAKILDTRKTTPGLRFLEKWAVTVGGGYNHRFGLYDMIMLKDNHNDYAGGITAALNSSKKYLEATGLNLAIEVETRNLDEVKEVLATGLANRIMFDNFSPALMKEAVELVDNQLETEASGGITIENIVPYAETGVDFISIGALTHSVKSLDISFKQGQ
jgi:nicotinate-nucleotide pyrophosphorylase (carboxylating)